jgi:Superinfection immunity protein
MGFTIIQLIEALAALSLYFVPSIISDRRKRPDTLMLALFNVCLGWTVIGWLIALRWALSAIPEPVDTGEVVVRRRIGVMRSLSRTLMQRARRTDARDEQQEKQAKARGHRDGRTS